jgi:peroxiredoxin Q/BCP
VLKPGDKAPAFTLKDQSGSPVKLSSFMGREVLVYFYPCGWTPGSAAVRCT